MNTTPTMAALSINTSHVGYRIQKKRTPLGERWSVMAEMAGGKRRKELVMCTSEASALTVQYHLRNALVALHEAARKIAMATRDRDFASTPH